VILALNVGNDFGQQNGLANIGVANRTFKIEIYLRDVKVWVDEKTRFFVALWRLDVTKRVQER